MVNRALHRDHGGTPQKEGSNQHQGRKRYLGLSRLKLHQRFSHALINNFKIVLCIFVKTFVKQLDPSVCDLAFLVLAIFSESVLPNRLKLRQTRVQLYKQASFTIFDIEFLRIMIWPFKPRFRKQIARIEVNGAIAGATRKRVLAALKTVEERKFPVLLLRIDSPGGTVGDSQEIYSALKRLGEKIKIVATFGNISASGGVYIGMGATHIVANPGTITGSIGVILRGNNLERLLDKIGVSFKVIKSGPYKDILAFDRELTDPEKNILQELIDVSYSQFVQTVAEARRLSVETVRSFADGRIFTGQQALELGIVDRLGTEEDARRWAAELAGLDPEKTECFTFEEKKSVLSRFFPGGDSALFSLGGNARQFTLVGDRLETSLPSRLLTTADWLEFELSTNGLPLWLYRP